MSITLNGTSQSVQFANGMTLVTARPVTLACLFDTTNIRTTGNWNTIIANGVPGSSGLYMSIQSQTNVGALYFQYRGANSVDYTRDAAGSAAIITANTGWWLVVGTIRDTGANTAMDLFAYRYNNNTWLTNTGNTGADQDVKVVAAGEATYIGNEAVFSEWFPGRIGWVAVWNADLSNGGLVTAPQLNLLRAHGPWAFLTRACTFFVPFYVGYSLKDIMTPGRSGTLVATPTWGIPGPTERKPVLPQLWLANAAAAAPAAPPEIMHALYR